MHAAIASTVLVGLLLQGSIAPVLADSQILEAIKYGESFKSRNEYLDKGLKNRKFQISSAWARDGISKYVVIFSDFDVISSAASKAKHEMREFSIEQARELPLTGMLYVNVQLHARGMLPVRRLEKDYTRDNTHLVLIIDGKVIQPLSKRSAGPQDASFIAPVALFTYWESNNISLLTGGPLGYSGERFEVEFAFKLTPEQEGKKSQVVLISGKDKRYTVDIDLSKLSFQGTNEH